MQDQRARSTCKINVQDQRVWKTRMEARLSALGFAVRRTVPVDDFTRDRPVFFLFFEFVGFGPQLGGHDSQALGGGEVEALTRDTDAIIRLASEKFGCWGRHGTLLFTGSTVQGR
jgi:hypothetical protein